MWFAAVLVFFIAEDVTCMGTGCQSKLQSNCSMGHLNHFPRTAEDLETYCRNTLNSFACGVKALQDCDGDVNFITSMNSSVMFLEKECYAEGEIFKVISRHLGCLEVNILSVLNYCRQKDITDMKNELPESRQIDLEQRGLINEEMSGNQCMIAIWKNSCIVKRVHNDCGQEVATATLSILENMDSHLPICSEELVSKMPALIEALVLTPVTEQVIDY